MRRRLTRREVAKFQEQAAALAATVAALEDLMHGFHVRATVALDRALSLAELATALAEKTATGAPVTEAERDAMARLPEIRTELSTFKASIAEQHDAATAAFKVIHGVL